MPVNDRLAPLPNDRSYSVASAPRFGTWIVNVAATRSTVPAPAIVTGALIASVPLAPSASAFVPSTVIGAATVSGAPGDTARTPKPVFRVSGLSKVKLVPVAMKVGARPAMNAGTAPPLGIAGIVNG